MNQFAFVKGYLDHKALSALRKTAAGLGEADPGGYDIPTAPVGADAIEPPPPPTGEEGRPAFQGAAVVDGDKVTEIQRAAGPGGDPGAPASVKHEVQYQDGSTMKVETRGPKPEGPPPPPEGPPPPPVDLPPLGSPELGQVPSLR